MSATDPLAAAPDLAEFARRGQTSEEAGERGVVARTLDAVCAGTLPRSGPCRLCGHAPARQPHPAPDDEPGGTESTVIPLEPSAARFAPPSPEERAAVERMLREGRVPAAWEWE
jgi:hypothetical protein